MSKVNVVEARNPSDFDDARSLFREYADELGVDLTFQNFAFELDHLAEMYAADRGGILLAETSAGIVGCVALRPFSAGVCEMKRLYVKDRWRKAGVGRQLVSAVLEKARGMGYSRMVLDTLARLQAAHRLYVSAGFLEVTPYYANPLPEVIYMEAIL